MLCLRREGRVRNRRSRSRLYHVLERFFLSMFVKRERRGRIVYLREALRRKGATVNTSIGGAEVGTAGRFQLSEMWLRLWRGRALELWLVASRWVRQGTL